MSDRPQGKSNSGLSPTDRKVALEFRTVKPVDRLADRKARFAELVEFVGQRHGWVTSVPGAIDCELQCLPGSTLPAEVAERFGVKPREVGGTQRILPHGITEHVITEGSTVPRIVTHAGIVPVTRFTFGL